jgi:long-chain acyl-CoA synthetase
MLSYVGGAIGFYCGDVKKLREDLETLKPTLFISVPRLYNRFYETIQEILHRKSGVERIVVDRATASKLHYLRNGNYYTHKIYDQLVFKKVKDVLGGRVRQLLCGSAAISSDVIDFLKIAWCAPVLEGYGCSETCAGSFITLPEDGSSGHVGGVLPHSEFKLIDVPDMRYSSRDTDATGHPQPRGELLIRGFGVSAGYYKADEATSESFDKDGWFHTGDIARINPNGSISIIDRKKNFFKLAQGEYVSPEKIEALYARSQYVSEIFVTGDSLQSHPVAIIVPRRKVIEELGQSLKLSGNFEVLCAHPEILSKVHEDFERIMKEDGTLFGFEKCSKFYLEPQAFQALGLRTPTDKLVRGDAKQYYKETIRALYAAK